MFHVERNDIKNGQHCLMLHILTCACKYAEQIQIINRITLGKLI